MTATTRTFRRDGQTQTATGLNLEAGLSDDCLTWIDITDPTDQEIEALAAEFHVPGFLAEDLLKGNQRPKIHVEAGFVFIVAYGANLDGDICTHEVHMLVSSQAVATIRHSPAYDIEPVVSRLAAVPNVYDRGVALVLYDLLDEMVDGYFTAVDELEDRIDSVEQLVFSAEQGGTDKEIQESVFALRKQIVAFYQISTAMRDVLNGILRHDVDLFPEKVHLYFLDIYDHLLRVNSSLELFRELVAGMFEAHLAVASNQMNKVMKKMTSWGAILLGATLIAGIYGMNFREMPELRFLYGYPMALAMMATLTITLWIVFKKKNWL
ncbi:MAG: magnesium and cobalt transport protein CorA [Acidobacteria bacterium]|nr:MAG: magnesium and cobalt transport protein CorA [Acidobacteriota bacterium]